MSNRWEVLADHLEQNRNLHQRGCWSSTSDRADFYRSIERQLTRLHYSGKTNSTKFTDCCGLAITRDQTVFSRCGSKISRQ